MGVMTGPVHSCGVGLGHLVGTLRGGWNGPIWDAWCMCREPHPLSQFILFSVKIVLEVGRSSFSVQNKHKYDISYLLCHFHPSL